MKKFLSLIIVIVLFIFTLGCEGDGVKEEFILKANVIKVDKVIEVDVIESDYAFGVYWVLSSDKTKFLSADGKAIFKSDLKVGDTVEITYGGQVMMSLPPQIVASKIKVIK